MRLGKRERAALKQRKLEQSVLVQARARRVGICAADNCYRPAYSKGRPVECIRPYSSWEYKARGQYRPGRIIA